MPGRWAWISARCVQRNSHLLLVSVVAGVWIERVGREIGPPLVHSGGRDRAASALKEAAGTAAAGLPGAGQVDRRLEVSSWPARGLHDRAVAERADLIVVGSSHHGPVGRVLLGSVGERLLSGAPCAVAIAPRGHAARDSHEVRRVAVAFDGSREAQLALRTGHELARMTEAGLHVLMVIEPPAAIPWAVRSSARAGAVDRYRARGGPPAPGAGRAERTRRRLGRHR